MYKETRAVYDALSMVDGLKVFTNEGETTSSVWLQFGLKDGKSYRIKFINTDDDNDISIRVYALVSITADQVSKMLPVLNELNAKYRFVKFVCDDDLDINVEYDFPVSCITPEVSAKEMVIRFTDIIDEAYPVLMRKLWE